VLGTSGRHGTSARPVGARADRHDRGAAGHGRGLYNTVPNTPGGVTAAATGSPDVFVGDP